MSEPMNNDRLDMNRRINASLYGMIDQTDGPQRLALCRQAGLYTVVSRAAYTTERIAAMLRQANARRAG
jgi:hypothetical protein